MNDYTALLAAILESPDDDAPRLIMADWLDENGDSERAEFIRVQCKKQKWPHVERCRVVRNVLGPELCKWFEFENQLNTITRTLCVSGWRGHRWMVRSVCANDYQVDDDGNFDFRSPLPRTRIYISRGFVSSITCTAADWLAHGPAIVAAHPVTRVEVSDRRPRTDSFGPIGNGYWWSGGDDRRGFEDNGNWLITPDVYRHIYGFRSSDSTNKYFPTEAAARDALSTACLQWARAQSREMAGV